MRKENMHRRRSQGRLLNTCDVNVWKVYDRAACSVPPDFILDCNAHMIMKTLKQCQFQVCLGKYPWIWCCLRASFWRSCIGRAHTLMTSAHPLGTTSWWAYHSLQFLWYGSNAAMRWKLRSIPGPSPSFLFGNLLDVRLSSHHVRL